MATLSRELQQEVIADCLTDRERNVLRLYGGGGVSRVLSLYQRELHDHDGVMKLIDSLHAKIERAAERKVRAVEHREAQDIEDAAMEAAGIEQQRERRRQRPQPEPEIEEPDEGESEAVETMPDAGASREAEVQHSAPPNGVAPAPERPVAPAAGPSPETSTKPVALPPGELPHMHPKTHERWKRIYALLYEQRRSKRVLVDLIGEGDKAVENTINALQRQGVVEPTEENAKDWEGAENTRRPSRVVKLIAEPEGCKLAPNSVPDRKGDYSGYKRAPKSKGGGKLAPTGQCDHGAPHTLCRICQPQLDVGAGEPAGHGNSGPMHAETPDFPDRFAGGAAVPPTVLTALRAINRDDLAREVDHMRRQLSALESLLSALDGLGADDVERAVAA